MQYLMTKIKLPTNAQCIFFLNVGAVFITDWRVDKEVFLFIQSVN